MILKSQQNRIELVTRPALLYTVSISYWLYDQMREWTTKFRDKKFIELTGDSQTPIPDLNKYDVVLTTPEKWDVVTRRFLSSDPGTYTTRKHKISPFPSGCLIPRIFLRRFFGNTVK